jgi:hypothetical protein
LSIAQKFAWFFVFCSCHPDRKGAALDEAVSLACVGELPVLMFGSFQELKRFGVLLKYRTSLTCCFAAFSNRKSLSTFSENALE